MFKLIGRLSVVLAFGWAGSSSAALMPPVSLNGKEWLQPADFLNVSWSDIAVACDPGNGVCNGSLSGNYLGGWTWASIPDLNALFTAFEIPSFLGSGASVELNFTANTTWAPNFLESFTSTNGTNQVGGILRDLNPPGLIPGAPVVALVGDNDELPEFFPGLVFDGASTMGGMDNIDTQDPAFGGWFFRAEVPSPATIPLFGIGLAVLGHSRRKRNPFA